jgi:hypothetical protein
MGLRMLPCDILKTIVSVSGKYRLIIYQINHLSRYPTWQHRCYVLIDYLSVTSVIA